MCSRPRRPARQRSTDGRAGRDPLVLDGAGGRGRPTPAWTSSATSTPAASRWPPGSSGSGHPRSRWPSPWARSVMASATSRRPARARRHLMTPKRIAPDGQQRPAQTQLRTAVGRHLLARRKSGVQIPSPPPHRYPGHRPGWSLPLGRRHSRAAAGQQTGSNRERNGQPLLDRGHDAQVYLR